VGTGRGRGRGGGEDVSTLIFVVYCMRELLKYSSAAESLWGWYVKCYRCPCSIEGSIISASMVDEIVMVSQLVVMLGRYFHKAAPFSIRSSESLQRKSLSFQNPAMIGASITHLLCGYTLL